MPYSHLTLSRGVIASTLLLSGALATNLVLNTPLSVQVDGSISNATSADWNVCGPWGCTAVAELCGEWGCVSTNNISPPKASRIHTAQPVALADGDLQQPVQESKAGVHEDETASWCPPNGCVMGGRKLNANTQQPLEDPQAAFHEDELLFGCPPNGCVTGGHRLDTNAQQPLRDPQTTVHSDEAFSWCPPNCCITGGGPHCSFANLMSAENNGPWKLCFASRCITHNNPFADILKMPAFGKSEL